MTIKRAIFVWLIGLTLLTLPLQCLIDNSSENIAAVCLVMASGVGVLLYLGVSDALNSQPLSTVALLGFCVTTHLGALIVQTAAWTPLGSNLYSPLYTFGVIVLYQWIAVAVHCTYRFFSPPVAGPPGLLRSLLGWMGLYRTPSVAALWFMGCVGLAAFVVARNESIIGKTGQWFTFLTWAPFLIPFFLREIGSSYCNARRSRLLLIGFTGVIGLMGLAFNARQIIFIGGLTIGLLYLFSGMRSKEAVTGTMIKKMAAAAVLVAIASVPLSDLATAMAIARVSRGKISPIAMIQNTYHLWRRPALLAAYGAENEAVSRYTAYDERYIANPGLARLVSTKFIDNSLHFAGALKSDEAKERLRDVSVQFAWAVLPEPLLNLMGIEFDKQALDYSMGDYIAYLSRGLVLGGHKTGSMFAQGQALFGPLFPFIYAIICLFLFGAMDLLTIRHRAGAATISALGMLEIWGYFNQGLHYEGLSNVLAFFVRNLEQMILIYVVIFAMARVVERSVKALLGYRPELQWQQSN